MSIEAQIVAGAAAVVLLAGVTKGSFGAGVAADVARRIADRAALAGVSLDDLAALISLADRG